MVTIAMLPKNDSNNNCGLMWESRALLFD